jgi:hypothetical protein
MRSLLSFRGDFDLASVWNKYFQQPPEDPESQRHSYKQRWKAQHQHNAHDQRSGCRQRTDERKQRDQKS